MHFYISYKNKKGFTLLDVLISAAIISLISSVVLFNVSEGRIKAEDAKKKNESAQVATAIELFKNDYNGRTPIAGLTVSGYIFSDIYSGELLQENSAGYQEVMSKLVLDGYISAIPTSSDGESYAYGENEEGTEAVFSVKLKSSSGSAGNTKNFCEVASQIEVNTGTPEFPECQNTYLGDSPSGDPVYERTCPSVEGFLVECTLNLVTYGLPSEEGEPEYIQDYVLACGYDIDPDYAGWANESNTVPLCNGTSNADYCVCI